MREIIRLVFRDIMMRRLKDTRVEMHLSQSKFAGRLLMDPRSYADLEHGVSCCSALTLIIYLAFFCENVPGFIDDIRKAILDAYKQHGDHQMD